MITISHRRILLVEQLKYIPLNYSVSMMSPKQRCDLYFSYTEILRYGAGFRESEYNICIQAENLVCINSDSKSGQVFWKSKDGSIVLKTIVSIKLFLMTWYTTLILFLIFLGLTIKKQYECRTLRHLLSQYYQHVLSEPSCIAFILNFINPKNAILYCKRCFSNNNLISMFLLIITIRFSYMIWRAPLSGEKLPLTIRYILIIN